MRHEHRDRHLVEELAGDTTEDHLSPASVTIGTHDDEIGAMIGSPGQQQITHIQVVCHDFLGFDLDAVTGEMQAQIGTRKIGAFLFAAARIRAHDLDLFRPHQKGQGVIHGAGRFPAAVPGDDDVLSGGASWLRYKAPPVQGARR